MPFLKYVIQIRMLKAQKQFLVALFDAFDLYLKKPLIAGRAATMQKGFFIPPWEGESRF
jgi:hypothetical protein